MSEPVRLMVKRLHPERDADLPVPRYMTAGAAGMDLVAANSEDITIEPGRRALIPTGLAIAVPLGFEAQVRARSGLAIRKGLLLPNAPGTIDADYRGEVKVILANFGEEPFVVTRGERIAQMVIAPVAQAQIVETDTLPDTERGDGGFGHTGA